MNDPKSRFKHHKFAGAQRMRDVIANGAILNILHENLTEQQARQSEKSYRPKKDIGWNLAPGGGYSNYDEHRSAKAVRTKRARGYKSSTLNMRWYNDGTDVIRLNKYDVPLRGFVPGRVPKAPKSLPKPMAVTLIVECPHCGVNGGKTVMGKWHFDRCRNSPLFDEEIRRKSYEHTCRKQSEETKQKRRGVRKEIVECPHCEKNGGKPVMMKWHFDNCKLRSVN